MITGETGDTEIVFRIGSRIFEALKDGYADNRIYPNVFPQGSKGPVWPAVRYTQVVTVPVQTIEGDGGDETADVTFQLDLVAKNNNDLVELRRFVKNRMRGMSSPEAVWDGEQTGFDEETSTHRTILTYVFYPSSGDGNSPS